MGLINENDQKFIVKYFIKNLTFTLKEKNDSLTLEFPSIISFEYLLNVEQNLMSVIKITLRLNLSKKTWIIRNRKDLEVIFNVAKYKYPQDNTDGEPYGDLVFEGKYIPLFTESSTSTDSSLIAETEKSDYDSVDQIAEENYNSGEEVMDIYLFKEKILKSSRISCNLVATKDTLQNIVGALLTKTHHKKVLMNKFQNEEEYIEMLIPENPLYRCLLYLDQYYGFYKAGAIIFYDQEQLYILDSSMKEPPKVEDEITNVNILVDSLSLTTPLRGIVEKENDEDKYFCISESEINSVKSSWINESDYGSKLYMNIIDPEDDKENDEKNNLLISDIEYIGKKRMRRYHNIEHENKYAKETLDARMNENESAMFINAMNIDVDYLKPNKLFTLIFSNAKKQAVFSDCKYRLAFAHTLFSQEDNLAFIANHRLMIKKCQGKLHNENNED